MSCGTLCWHYQRLFLELPGESATSHSKTLDLLNKYDRWLSQLASFSKIHRRGAATLGQERHALLEWLLCVFFFPSSPAWAWNDRKTMIDIICPAMPKDALVSSCKVLTCLTISLSQIAACTHVAYVAWCASCKQSESRNADIELHPTV